MEPPGMGEVVKRYHRLHTAAPKRVGQARVVAQGTLVELSFAWFDATPLDRISICLRLHLVKEAEVLFPAIEMGDAAATTSPWDLESIGSFPCDPVVVDRALDLIGRGRGADEKVGRDYGGHVAGQG